MTTVCKNCGSEYSGNYCNNCGQKAKVGRLTFRSVIDNWMYGLTNCDTGILFTCKELFTRPGRMMADYIRGKRVIYFQPFPMLFITAGLYGLISQIFVPAKEAEFTFLQNNIGFWERFFEMLFNWAHSSMSFVAIVTLPIFAWAARYTFYIPSFHPFRPSVIKSISNWFYYYLTPFKKTKTYIPILSDYKFISTYTARLKYLNKHHKYSYNFTEYIFIFAYIACQRLIIGLFIGIPLLLFTNIDQWGQDEMLENNNTLIYLLYFAVMVWDIQQLFKLNFIKAFWKTLVLLFYWSLLLLLLTLLFAGIVVGIIYVLGSFHLIPESLMQKVFN